MSEYYVITFKLDSQSTFGYDTLNAALAAFHAEMAYAYNTGTTTVCVITDKLGNQLRNEHSAPSEGIATSMSR